LKKLAAPHVSLLGSPVDFWFVKDRIFVFDEGRMFIVIPIPISQGGYRIRGCQHIQFSKTPISIRRPSRK
jgi:hypothetical protein